MIGIDESRRLYYEGTSNYGHAIWPSPFVSIATWIAADRDWMSIPQSGSLMSAPLVFREDAFDPVTRIKRGRFYTTQGVQPQTWYVQKHTAYDEEVGRKDHQGRFMRSLCTFDIWRPDESLRAQARKVIVALGIKEANLLWNIVGIERITTGEDLVTLRARSAFGVLPDLNVAQIPELARPQIEGLLDKVADAAYRAGPESVIDRCRDAASAILGQWMAHEFGEEQLREEDLSKLATKLGELTELRKLARKPGDKAINQRTIVINTAKTIARLHARAKPNEQFRHDSRPVTEADAECAIALVGLLLRELNWAMS